MPSTDVQGKSKVIKSTIDLTVFTATAYAVGDQLGARITLVDAVRGGEKGNRTGVLQSVVVKDADGQNAPIDLVFYSTEPTVTSIDNGAFASTWANGVLAAGYVNVLSLDYISLGTTSCAVVRNVGLLIEAASGSSDVYCHLISRGTPTYTTATSLQVEFHILQD